MPKVSVIVPNYNHAPFLHQRIDSVLGQTFQDFELILLDDGSSDDSRSILSSYAASPRIRVDFSAANSGSTFKQWNRGVGLARGAYVWIAESDDYAEPRYLERLVGALDSEPRAAFVYCRSRRVSASGTVGSYQDSDVISIDPLRWTSDFVCDGREECRNFFSVGNVVVNASAVVFRKAVYEQVGGADESFRWCGDWQLWAAMALTGKVLYIAEPLNYFRSHESSVTSNVKDSPLAAREYLRVIHWILGRVTPPPERLQLMRASVSSLWIRPLTSGGVPFAHRLKILRSALAIDPYALPRLTLPMLTAIRLKLLQGSREVQK